MFSLHDCVAQEIYSLVNSLFGWIFKYIYHLCWVESLWFLLRKLPPWHLYYFKFQIGQVTMVGHPMLWMIFYFVAEVANANCPTKREFKVLEDPHGSKLCALDASSDTLSMNSVLECALECQRFWYCENFNYNNVSQKCDIFFNRPICYGPLSSCIHYRVIYSKILLSMSNSWYSFEKFDIKSRKCIPFRKLSLRNYCLDFKFYNNLTFRRSHLFILV